MITSPRERRRRDSLRQFSQAHLVALAVLVVTATAPVLAARRHPGDWMPVWSVALACVIASSWVGEYVIAAARGTWSAEYGLPLQLTDAVSAVAVLALLTRRALLVELLYFWSLTASLQALLTPDLGQTFPDVYYFTYFGYHIGAVAAASFLVFGWRLYPRAGAMWRVLAVTLAFAAVAAVANLLTGGNYMYLRAKPVHNSLLNVIGPWPWYIAATVVLAVPMLLVLQLLADALRGRERVA